MQVQVCGIQGVSRKYPGGIQETQEEAKIFILPEESQDVVVTRSSSTVNTASLHGLRGTQWLCW